MSHLGKAAFIFGIGFLIFWYFAASKFILILLDNTGLLPKLINDILANLIIPFILLIILEAEIFIKLHILESTPKKLNIELVSLDNIYEVNHVSIRQYTQSLQSLGFVRIVDLKERETVVRLFWHPEYHCAAEVLQSINKLSSYTYCGISNAFEQGWTLTFLDNDINQQASYALRVPKKLTVFKSRLPLEKLLNSFLEFRTQIIPDLNITIINDISVDFYIDVLNKARKQIRQKILWKSIIFMFIEMFLFSLKTDDEKHRCFASYSI
jgi:hypothetical protein